ncbi:Gluconolactonase precursor [Anatilimnocola aggregata]|uniref:Gluconolactonase n=1 Tax=Anatilimnocola aggregata TaxID=2528021 RepID=A0A517YHJ4_9BACT|nr:SMP-30/gluconolactonase/LRE family protein [Anatilimnocola aggregata]QDU29682.1 Gluconolactonase precursor [Anatilimnocola aggregata]
MLAWLLLAATFSGELVPADVALLETFRDEFVLITPGSGKFPADEKVKEPFAISRYEVTQNVWGVALGKNPSEWKGERNSCERFDFQEAKHFCERITSELRNRKLIGPKQEIRLPTSDEWNYAAAAGTKTKYSFGDDESQLGQFGWFHGNAAGNDPVVGAKKPNDWGLYDVHGYLWEWCTTEAGPVLRGGSWTDPADQLATAIVKKVAPETRGPHIGLRCVLAGEGITTAKFVAVAEPMKGVFAPVKQRAIIPETSKLEKLWAEGEFTEGPATAPDGSILFSDIGTKIFRFDPTTKQTKLFREPSGRSNGLLFDASGRLIACEGANTGGNRRISITTGIQGATDGKIETLADNFEGKRFNSPNDLAIDGQGRTYFTDPRYVGDDPRDLDFEAVFIVDAPTAGKKSNVRVATREVQKPNGILVSADGKTVFIADNNPKGNVQLVAMSVEPDGKLADKRVLFDFVSGRGIDGMTLDKAGNIYATAGTGKKAGIYVFSSSGEHLAFIATPGDPTNCTFGANQNEGAYLYITASTGPKNNGQDPKFGLFRILLPVQGQHVVKLMP